MLSYQHIYHAGNLADVQKHALLCQMLAYLTVKDKPLNYFETHSGRGLYGLDAAEAVKTGEAAAGIDAVAGLGWFDAAHPYMQALQAVRDQHGPRSYPGSPLLARQLLRDQDRMSLAELHPQEHAALDDLFPRRQANVVKQDGYQMVMERTPPEPRRGLLLIDPAYEVKSEYDAIPGFVAKLHRKWNVGVIAIWYPVLTTGAHKPMLKALEALDLPKVLRHEVSFGPARQGHRMIGSGMIVVNTPFGTEKEAARLSSLYKKLS
ncbi:Ribosomal RNA large subunit methyltransferase J [Thalassovita autumnalis]|uniref:Ribosomal RNA large subunit methyltransferase J n=1 Tax=Thalassovita autumnalis TaxID=2072972 RepID=A0A0P1F5G3_9RHOB|nr:23S rRNA (adenine(2030)-N(6))-methyltransferase RlmJ [Thalassovita autumnalis]CUH63107.1 Ribosomal RNA large subunit methyltransferase J [Thalassovita autumnalis]CUH72075.1 Ribosomal RNA large subunit methyltransferase J [Thalassovita autumnalis]